MAPIVKFWSVIFLCWDYTILSLTIIFNLLLDYEVSFLTEEWSNYKLQ